LSRLATRIAARTIGLFRTCGFGAVAIRVAFSGRDTHETCFGIAAVRSAAAAAVLTHAPLEAVPFTERDTGSVRGCSGAGTHAGRFTVCVVQTKGFAGVVHTVACAASSAVLVGVACCGEWCAGFRLPVLSFFVR